jgi:hypothetical protein
MTMKAYTQFSRALLSRTMQRVKEAGIEDYKKAWVWTMDRRTWEFHYKDYFGTCSASDAYEARHIGWAHYLLKTGKAYLLKATTAGSKST